MSDSYDRDLGMDRPITRRDFMNGAAMAIGGTLFGGLPALESIGRQEPQNQSGYYPPRSTGLRGSHLGSFEIAHSLRDGTFWNTAGEPLDTREAYDLVIVGAGISGLSAAYFFREQAGKPVRVLILENHDDFGGHAKRNEFHLGGGLQLLNGGTLLIDSPTPYSAVADGLLKKLGVNPPEFEQKFADHKLYRSLGLRPAVFFDKETFGEDRLVPGLPEGDWMEGGDETAEPQKTWREFLEKTPLAPEVQRDILRIQSAKVDYLEGLSSVEKKAQLSKMSYRDFLLNVVKADSRVIAFYQRRTEGEWGVGIDAEPALDCWAIGLPGFQGMSLEQGSAPHMSYSAAGYADGGSYRFHFPDGNASIARLLVRELIPDAVEGHTGEDIVTSRVDYSRLDRESAPIRIRLNSTVVRVENVEPASRKQVQVLYANGKQVYRVPAKACVLACWNMVIPHLCPDLPEEQKQALHYLVKVPLVYTSVGIRKWTSFEKLGIAHVSCPGSYWSEFSLNWPVNLGSYRSPSSPHEPILVHLSRAPSKPGLPAREQHKAGRYELLTTSFEVFERNIRDQLARTLKDGGFDPARDIAAITVNRWPHGYGYEYNPLFDPDWPEDQRPNVIGRRRFGNITIANTDSAATAYTDTAIDQAYRAVSELMGQ